MHHPFVTRVARPRALLFALATALVLMLAASVAQAQNTYNAGPTGQCPNTDLEPIRYPSHLITSQQRDAFRAECRRWMHGSGGSRSGGDGESTVDSRARVRVWCVYVALLVAAFALRVWRVRKVRPEVFGFEQVFRALMLALGEAFATMIAGIAIALLTGGNETSWLLVAMRLALVPVVVEGVLTLQAGHPEQGEGR